MIFEDAVLQAKLLQQAATLGHVRINLQDEQEYVAELSAEHSVHLLTCASLVATALFETMGAHGTNMIIQSGGQLRADVYAREQDDGLGLMWDPSPADQEELAQVASKLKDAFWYVGKDEGPSKKPTQSPEPKKEVESPGSEQDDYRIKQLKRSP